MKNRFWYRNWWLFYLLMFLLLGLLIYALLSHPRCQNAVAPNASVMPADQTQQMPTPDTPTVVDCNAEVNSGGQGKTVTKHSLGSHSGRVILQYDMYTVPDMLTVYYDNRVIATTQDLVSGEGQLQWNYTAQNGKPQECIVEVQAPEEDTKWIYQLNCPQ